MSKLKVGLLFGGKSEEHEVSIMSARSVYRAADKQKYELIPQAISREGFWLNREQSLGVIENEQQTAIYTGPLSRKETIKNFLNLELDLVFPLIHGPYGEDGRIQGLLEILDLPYVGPGVLSSAVGMDKGIMKDLFARHNLPQPRYLVITEREYSRDQSGIISSINSRIGFPCFVKPANLGSSIGISRVNHSSGLDVALDKAFGYDKRVVVDQGITGRELECSVLGNRELRASLPGEILPGHEFYDYQAKYEDRNTQLIIPAELDRETREEIQGLAVRAFEIIKGQGLARVDFFLRESDHQVLINEINTIPGFTEYSMYPKLWEVSGIEYCDLIEKLIQLALEK